MSAISQTDFQIINPALALYLQQLDAAKNTPPLSLQELAERKKELQKQRRLSPIRFYKAIASSKYQAKENGYVPCTATAEELASAFTGKCHFCGMPEELYQDHFGSLLCIDHDHVTGKFRGWLCNPCNVKDVLATKA
jgi:hypothetical protein